ncbi:MAG: TetR/AcrR family transcriptional regulator [Tannerella sp.]|jgi:AcrR family transcriptional regulator|nr:TetR/AcrR family transcriptional regulator [Tannerella sp.]
MLQTHILKTAVSLFSRNGIKKVSMDEIARYSGVSKRTLYEFFENKEDLLLQVLKMNFSSWYEYLTELMKQPNTALDVILLFFDKRTKDNPAWICDAFYEDIFRYTDAYRTFTENKDRIMNVFFGLLKRGVKEDVFLPEIDFDMLTILAGEWMKKSLSTDVFSKYDPAEVFDTVFLIFMRGICTDKGREILKRYIMKLHYKKEGTIQ